MFGTCHCCGGAFRWQQTGEDSLSKKYGWPKFLPIDYTGTPNGTYIVGGWATAASRNWSIGEYAKKVHDATVSWWVCIEAVSSFSGDPESYPTKFASAETQTSWVDTYYVAGWAGGIDDFNAGDTAHLAAYNKTGGLKAGYPHLHACHTAVVNAASISTANFTRLYPFDANEYNNHLPLIMRGINWDAANGFIVGGMAAGTVVEERDGETVIGLYQCINGFNPNAVASRPSTDTARWRSVTGKTAYTVYRHDWERTNKYCPEQVKTGCCFAAYINGSWRYQMASVDMEPGNQESPTHYDLSAHTANYRTRFSDPGLAARNMGYSRATVTMDTRTSQGVTVTFALAGGDRYHRCVERSSLAIDGGSTYTREVQYDFGPNDYIDVSHHAPMAYHGPPANELTAFGVMSWPSIPDDAADDNGSSTVGAYDEYLFSWVSAPTDFAVGDMIQIKWNGSNTHWLRCVVAYTHDGSNPLTNGKWVSEAVGKVYRNRMARFPHEMMQTPVMVDAPIDAWRVTDGTALEVTQTKAFNWWAEFDRYEFHAGLFTADADGDSLTRADGKRHGFAGGESVYVGNAPSGVVENYLYTVHVIDPVWFELRDGGVTVDITANGSCFVATGGTFGWGKVCSADAATDKIHCVSHGRSNLDEVVILEAKGATLPGGVARRAYYVSVIDVDNFQLLLEPSDAAPVNITSDGSGCLTITSPAAGSWTTKAVEIKQRWTLSEEFTDAEFAQAVAVGGYEGTSAPSPEPPGGGQIGYFQNLFDAGASQDEFVGPAAKLPCRHGWLFPAHLWFRNVNARLYRVKSVDDDCTTISAGADWLAMTFDPRVNDFVAMSVQLNAACPP